MNQKEFIERLTSEDFNCAYAWAEQSGEPLPDFIGPYPEGSTCPVCRIIHYDEN